MIYLYIVSSPIRISRKTTPVSNPSFDITSWGCFISFVCWSILLVWFVWFLLVAFLFAFFWGGGVFFLFLLFLFLLFVVALLCFFYKVHCFCNYSTMFKHRIVLHFKELANKIIIGAKVYCKSNFIRWGQRCALFMHYTIFVVQITELT